MLCVGKKYKLFRQINNEILKKGKRDIKKYICKSVCFIMWFVSACCAYVLFFWSEKMLVSRKASVLSETNNSMNW